MLVLGPRTLEGSPLEHQHLLGVGGGNFEWEWMTTEISAFKASAILFAVPQFAEGRARQVDLQSAIGKI